MMRNKNILQKSDSDIEKAKRAMLEAAMTHYGFTSICKAAGIHPIDGRLLLGADSNLAYQMQEMRDMHVDMLEERCYERAMGIEQDVFNKDGDLTGTRTVYSDQMAKLVLQGEKPEKYGNKVSVNHNMNLHDQFVIEHGREIEAEWEEVQRHED